MSNEILLINFSDPPSDSGSDAESAISLELDRDRHIDLYGEARTSFVVGETAYLRFLFQFNPVTGQEDKYTLTHTKNGLNGISVKITGTKVPFKIIETLSYVNSNVENIKHIINYTRNPSNVVGAPSWTPTWEFVAPANQTAFFKAVGLQLYVYKVSSYGEGNLLNLTADITATYWTNGNRLEVTSDVAGDVKVVLTLNEVDYTITIPFAYESDEDPVWNEDDEIWEDPSDDTPVSTTYTINVTSLCAEGVIGGVAVSKDGTPLGNTDGYGQLTFDSLPGTYTFKAVKTGYTTVSKSVTLT